MSRPESVSSRIAERGLEHRHLEDLVPLLLAAGEALVDRALDELVVELDDLRPLLHEGEELEGVELREAAVLADRVRRRLQEVDVAHPGDLDRVLEGEEDALAGPHLGREGEEVLALVEDLALGDGVAGTARPARGRGCSCPIRSGP